MQAVYWGRLLTNIELPKFMFLAEWKIEYIFTLQELGTGCVTLNIYNINNEQLVYMTCKAEIIHRLRNFVSVEYR